MLFQSLELLKKRLLLIRLVIENVRRIIILNSISIQELFELTQRKFLRLTTGFADAMNTRPYPRLFAVDLMTAQTKTAQDLARLEVAATQAQGSSESKKDDERDLEAEKKRDEEVLKKQQARKNEFDEEQIRKLLELKRKRLRLRALCEHEENWHPAGNPFEIAEDSTLENSAPYLTRILLLMKQSDLEMEILNTPQGEKEQQKLNEVNVLNQFVFSYT